jgi:hypothetical protein
MALSKETLVLTMQRISLACVLKVTGNNFRHYEKWRRGGAAPTDRQASSLRVIASVLEVPLPDMQSCANHPFGNIVAWWILKKIGGGAYLPLELAFRESAPKW